MGRTSTAELRRLTTEPSSNVYQPLIDEIIAGRRNIFLTGRAGTGKTTLLRQLIFNSLEKAIVLAPTGLAAVNVGGQTIHSFFNFPPRLLDMGDTKKIRNQRVVKAIETMVIDEVSMVRADMMQAIDNSLRLNRGNRQPFGGVRMILSGDLHQLPPVVGSDVEHILEESYGGAWFFKAPGFQAGQFRLAALKRIFRQEDASFIRILNGLRNARLAPEDVDILRTRVSTRSPADASQTHVVLTPNNAAAWRINQMRLAELPGPARDYTASLEGNFEPKAFPTEEVLELKAGARVMMIRNDPSGRWVNGSLGVVQPVKDQVLRDKASGYTWCPSAAWGFCVGGAAPPSEAAAAHARCRWRRGRPPVYMRSTRCTSHWRVLLHAW